MHYKRRAALLKMIFRAKGRTEKIVFNLAADVHRHPNKYSTEEKLRLAEFLSRTYYRMLKDLGVNLTCQKTLDNRHENPLTTPPAEMSAIQKERPFSASRPPRSIHAK